MTERSTIIDLIPSDFWELVKHPLDYTDVSLRENLRKVAFAVMRSNKCPQEEKLKIQAFLDQKGCG